MPKPQTEAVLSFVSGDNQCLVVSTNGTKAAPSAKITDWRIKWGDDHEEIHPGIPPPTLTHDYSSPGPYPVYFAVKDSKSNAHETRLDVLVRGPIPIPPSASYGPTAALSCSSGITIPVGSTTASRQTLINANPGATFCIAAGLHTANGPNFPTSGQIFNAQYGAVIDGTGWSSSDQDDAVFRGVNNGVVNVQIKNLVMRIGPSYGVNSYLSSSGWILDHCEIHHFRNGASAGTNGVISSNSIHHNEGIRGDPDPSLRGGGIVLNSAAGVQIIDNEVSYNGSEQKFIYGTTGVQSRDLYIARNFYHHNYLDGLWIDGDGTNSIMEDNICEDNGRTGITIEIGSGVTVRRNTCRRNLAEGILISATRDCSFTNNVLEDNAFGLSLFLDFARLTEIYPFWTVDLTGNVITNNRIKVPIGSSHIGAGLSFIGAGDQTPYLNNTKNNNYQSNRYIAPDTTSNWFQWGNGVMKNFTQWKALPQDTLGTIEVG